MSIKLLGTSHISPESARKVHEEVLSGRYDIIALELDTVRLQTLFAKRKQDSFWALVKVVGVSGAVFARIGHWVQQKLGGRIGVEPGDEMRAAVKAAATNNLRIALIDQPIHVTLQRFSTAFTFREKLRLLKNSFKPVRIKIDLRAAPSDEMVESLIGELKKASPVLYNVLVDERNEYMVARLRALEKQHPEAKILAVVGAGHVPGMKERLKESTPG